jgi:hypothetical protein
VLLEAAPEDMNLEDLRAHLAGVPHVLGVHDLHAWTVTSGQPALSAHVVIEDSCFNDGTPPASSTSSKTAWSATSTSSTPPFSWKPSPTPRMSPAPTSRRILARGGSAGVVRMDDRMSLAASDHPPVERGSEHEGHRQ